MNTLIEVIIKGNFSKLAIRSSAKPPNKTVVSGDRWKAIRLRFKRNRQMPMVKSFLVKTVKEELSQDNTARKKKMMSKLKKKM
jgi:hypothetical protein